jgi:RHH-type proline utilization regulon transcriptional repressor/proline dehydrogenase/delta 1-pyrroline-5-carboxylate dehydrogenase
MEHTLPQESDFPADEPESASSKTLNQRERIDSVFSKARDGYSWVDPESSAAKELERGHAAVFSAALELGSHAPSSHPLDAASFFQRHGADSAQGIALMMLAESLARAPDDKARQALLFDILPRAQWDQSSESTALESLAKLSSRFGNWKPDGMLGAGIKALGQAGAGKIAMGAISAFAKAFVAGQGAGSIAPLCAKHGLWSFDMLGEAASTVAEADLYFNRYLQAIAQIPSTLDKAWHGQGLSVKLSALDPLFDRRHEHRSLATERLVEIARACQDKNILLTVDAEEAERLVLSLGAIETALSATRSDWEGFGWAIQSNLRSCEQATLHAIELAARHKRRICVRLVKGAYWDSETRKAVAGGYPSPAWPTKALTDRSWISSAAAFAREPLIYPMLATHNPHSCAAALHFLSQYGGPFEFQRLHGMGAQLHAKLASQGHASRVYAPLGKTEELLPYLARRMLENGANTSILRFGHEDGFDPGVAFANPFTKGPERLAPSWECAYEPQRANSPGFPLWIRAHETHFSPLARALTMSNASSVDAPRSSPCDSQWLLGQVEPFQEKQISSMLDAAQSCLLAGGIAPHKAGAALDSACRALDIKRDKILATIIAETGKTMDDALGEWREARDFCAFHARQATQIRTPQRLPSLPGEENWSWLIPSGIALCVGPWNFPFAILMGQATAALAAGCPVIAKGASSTVLCAKLVVECLRDAGFGPAEIQHLVTPGSNMTKIVDDPRIGVIAFTGSTQAAREIALRLALRPGLPPRFIAETGGFNLMLIDETAHLDSACKDILESAFNMSGQRCSSLRAAWIDERIFAPLMSKLEGALNIRQLGDPSQNMHADYGPLINQSASLEAQAHLDKLLSIDGHRLVARAHAPSGLASAAYFAPAIVETRQASMIREEMFCPILQVARFSPGEERRLSTPWAQGGYGLTFGIQTRKPAAAELWAGLAPAGNIYINRPIIGATVGSQPFGGEGLSGTGPKIGGVHYVQAFCRERSLSNNNAAMGGCVDLLGDGRSSLHRFFDTPHDES